MKAFRAISLYLISAVILALIILYGTSISQKIIDYLNEQSHTDAVTDVQVTLQDSYVVGKTYSPKYTPIGNFGSDAELVFTALDDTVTVTKDGTFQGVKTESDSTVGRIKITSTYDTEFEKIITLKFEKKYPADFTGTYTGIAQGHDRPTLAVGAEVKTAIKASSSELYSESDYTVGFDREYIKKIGKDKYVPIKPTPQGVTTCFTFTMGNGQVRESNRFAIVEPAAIEDFDEIELKPSDDSASADNIVGTGLFIFLRKDGERVALNYKASSKNGHIKIGSTYNISLNSAGDDTLTVTLDNGFTKSIDISIRNRISLPEIESELVNDDVIRLHRYQKNTLPLSFPSGTTYKNISLKTDSSILSASAGTSALTLEGLKSGETQLTLILDDGVDRVEKTYTVKVVMNETVDDLIRYETRLFVSKFIGHLWGFGILAFFGMWAFRYVKIKNKILRFLAYSTVPLIVAAVTEYVQTFMPNRSGRIEDVILDMASYYIGTGIVLIINLIVLAISTVFVYRRWRRLLLSHRAKRIVKSQK